ncbi:SH3 domain-containing protein [Halobacteriovorax sp. ZH4_bin.1]|uniref:SH3 domain-containing protein n=1 Tax=unclassified Halobacteriovorax TaxID=2639665 RepID=UPI00371684F5
MRIFLVFFLLLPVFAQQKAPSRNDQKKTIYYVQSVYSQLHQNPSKFSRVLSTFECGQPFYVLSSPISEFYQVEYSNYKGFMSTNVLSQRKPDACWQDMYRRFFDQIEIGVTEIHYWGRLQDLLIKGESK